MKSICVALFLLCCCALAQRLPKTTVPTHYKLSLDPRLEDKKFSADETIDIRINVRVNEIVLNSVDLDISEADIVHGGKTLKADVVYDRPDEMVRLQVLESLEIGEAQIHVRFSGKLTEGLRGLYLSKSVRREYAVTQFEGTYARMMFPCFDEPGFKATFDLTVMANKNDTAISNGSILKDESIDGNRHEITFSTSPKMSTYLVGLAIGDWKCLTRTADGVPIRVCAVPEKSDYGAFALEVAAHSIEFYDRWYGIRYPFGKLDMVAIPDYEWGGMENTASIFYRDSAMLLDEKHASVFRKRHQAVVIAHEIAHQWFGDLVTAAWWDDIWLNEGFATWMARKPIEAWHPEWHLEDDASAEAQGIISTDSLTSARAIHGNPSTPSEIKEMFDGITYAKGGAVLRMLESYLGPEVFRQGVNTYLAAHANGNATSADFWQAEARISGKPVDTIMPTYVLQAGVPMLSFSQSCTEGVQKLEFKQQRFLIASNEAGSRENQQWQIPVCTKSNLNHGGSCALVTQSQQTELAPGCAAWIFGNRNADGYYRVAYTPEQLRDIANVAEQQLNIPERIALVEDAWAMTRAGKASIGDFLSLSQQLRDERSQQVIDLLANHLHYVADSLIVPSQQQIYNAFVRDQFAALAKQIGWIPGPNDTDEQKALRASLLQVLGSAADPGAVAQANKLVSQYMQDPGSVEETLVGSAFEIAAVNGNAELYDHILAELKKSKSFEEYYLYLDALTHFRYAQLLERTLALVDRDQLREEDYPAFFGALLANPASRVTVWTYLKNHWSDLAQKVTSFGGFGAVSALGNACSAEMRADVSQFFTDHPAPGAERAVRQSLEGIDSCIAFKQQQEQNMETWLARRRTPSSQSNSIRIPKKVFAAGG